MMLRDPSELLEPLLDGGHSIIAGRLIGALRHIGNAKMADDILKTMQSADYLETASVESNITPFADFIAHHVETDLYPSSAPKYFL